MSLYIIGSGSNSSSNGGGGGATTPGAPNHFHSTWESPVDQGDAKTFKVSHGNYLLDSLDVAVAPLDESGNPTNYDLQLQPFYLQTDPARGLIILDGTMPSGWSLIVRYIYR